MTDGSDLVDGVPHSAYFAACHTFPGEPNDTDRAFPHVCCAEDCPARPYVRPPGTPMFQVVDL